MSDLIKMHNYYADLSDSFDENGTEEERVNHMKYAIIARAYLREIDTLIDEAAASI